MQKFLIIIKFTSAQEFSRFYDQFSGGRFFLPSPNPLPEQSVTLLKLIIPLLKAPVMVNGVVVSKDIDHQTGSGMTINISDDLQTVLPELVRKLSVHDPYRDIAVLPDSEPEAPAAVSDETPELEPDELTGLELEITEDEILALDGNLPNHPPSKKADPPPVDSFRLKSDWEDDLNNLKMENEADDFSTKIDLAHLPDFELLDDDTELVMNLDDDDTGLGAGAEESQLEPEPEHELEPEPAAPLKIDRLPEKKTESEKISLDFDSDDSDLNLPENQDNSGVLFDDLKEMVEQGEFELEEEELPPLTPKKIPEKKELTPEERLKAEPVGQFFMNLTKAMLRSGYYAPGHPGADSAKAGLYDEFIGVLGNQREIMITNHHSREGIDLMLTGILDEPVSIRVLVGPGVAELFVPKLSEYCERKKLLSFALKRVIKNKHFYQFIDIMSDPRVDNQKNSDAGKILTNAFIKYGITDISTVFVDDMVALETDLPWRVEMAIHRLAKDLKVMPMFKGVSNDAIKKMKLQTVQDIIRPLKHPTYLNDFLVNCYLIAKYVKTMAPEEIEEIVVEAFSIDLLLPTSRFTFKELDALKLLKVDHPDNPQIDRRLAGIKRILKLISRRVVVEKESGGQTFLQELYRNDILSFNELPADVQYMVNTLKMADDIRENYSKYASIIARVKKPNEALVYLKCFRRVIPVMIDSGEWTLLEQITQDVKNASSHAPFNSDTLYSGLTIIKADAAEDFSKSKLFALLDVSERPLGFMFKDAVDKIIKSYERSEIKERLLIDNILNSLGSLGVDIISKMLVSSSDREVRKLSYEMMISKGDQARNWAIKVLEDIGRPWFIHRNAMMILGKVSQNEEDFACVRPFHNHTNPKIREEVLNAAVSLKPKDGELLVLKSINDEDPKVRWRALRTIEHFCPISESAMNGLLSIITLPIPKNSDEAEIQVNKTVHIISAINAMTFVPMNQRVEAEIIDLLNSFSEGKQSLWKKVKRVVGNDYETPVLKAAIPLLGKIGGSSSKTYLKKIIRQHPDMSDIIKKALLQIKA